LPCATTRSSTSSWLASPLRPAVCSPTSTRSCCPKSPRRRRHKRPALLFGTSVLQHYRAGVVALLRVQPPAAPLMISLFYLCSQALRACHFVRLSFEQRMLVFVCLGICVQRLMFFLSMTSRSFLFCTSIPLPLTGRLACLVCQEDMVNTVLYSVESHKTLSISHTNKRVGFFSNPSERIRNFSNPSERL